VLSSVKSLSRCLRVLVRKTFTKHRDRDASPTPRFTAIPDRAARKAHKNLKRRPISYSGPLPVGYWPYPPWGLPPYGCPFVLLTPPALDPQTTTFPHPPWPYAPRNDLSSAADWRDHAAAATHAPRLWPVLLPHTPSRRSLHDHDPAADHGAFPPTAYHRPPLPPPLPPLPPPYTFGPWVYPPLAHPPVPPDLPRRAEALLTVATKHKHGKARRRTPATQSTPQTDAVAAYPAVSLPLPLPLPHAQTKPTKKRKQLRRACCAGENARERVPTPVPMRGVRFTSSTKDSD
jgi:hypothetical protein